MTVDRRSICSGKHPICMTTGVMFGMVMGVVLATTSHSWIEVGVTIGMATLAFHVTFVKNFNLFRWMRKSVKKGS